VPLPKLPIPTPEQIAGVILAGGQGTRMGGADKGWVEHEGIPLVGLVLVRLLPQVGQVIISANRSLERYRSLGYPVVEDDHERFGRFSGPLAGMHAGLRASPLPWVAFVPCDAPAFPLDLVARLAQATGGNRPALACCQGRRQPVFCLMPRALANALALCLTRKEQRPTEFLRLMDAVEVPFPEPQAFANINARPAQGA